ncbi:4Fe-4S dicluster domain-containing protein [Pseudomonas sp. N040]|uniref:4Fe-4S dicluster domain-containing protein n=1 Tax=Pseudomonas sp. N040 TaxID=2785325 RepID=UPI0018A263B9|nr:4Fe-4S dicluster domain-containing protein [Pseudomonas sp. N040]MBF7729268.1 4Fe-4S dicluster domain-containing protein [Pseudomonas sp. N040]MBW7012908.1 4Fe-4S dicluster domain-containing protein [Pseudomonas sp. N040]
MQAFELDRPERLRAHLAVRRKLYEVRADGQGGQHWQSVTAEDPAAFCADAATPSFSAKSFFFAERELLFRFDGGQFLSALPEVAPQVLFGLHACDLRAVAYQDRFFAEDPFYQTRRNATLLVGVDCLDSCAGGFCTTVDSGPDVRAGTADLILLPRASGPWLLLVASAAGTAAIEGLALPPASGAWQAERQGNSAQVAQQQGAQADIVEGVARLNAGLIEAATWERLGLQCLGCSGCTTVCPTCSCFAPLDQSSAAGGVQRERVWDSCLYQGFQKEASGHNPSATPGSRVQRFWFHKFGDDFKARFEHYGCVGCGRCDRVCPGGIGVHGVMHKVAQA